MRHDPMTQDLTLGIDGQVAALMRNALSPAVFAEACQWIVANHEGDDAHRKLDMMVTSLLTSLGYGEGMEIFLASVERHHRRAA